MKPTVRLLSVTALEPDFAEEVGSTNPLKLVEYAGRWDYGPKSVAKMVPDDLTIIGRWLKQGEESMIEMVDAAFKIECSRVVSHELVRHRIASYQQESQRFVEYAADEDLFYFPPEFHEDEGVQDEVEHAYETAFESYLALRKLKVPKQLARYVLPNATKTAIIAKLNLRAWRHVLKLRMHSSAQPEMREVMVQIHAILADRFPEVFSDIKGDERAPR